MTGERADIRPHLVSGVAATMTVLAMGLGYAISIGDPTVLSTNLQFVADGLQISPDTASFVASLASLAMAATVLAAGALGDKFGMRRMYLVGLCGSIVFSAISAAAPMSTVLMVARAGEGVALAFLIGLSLAITNAVFPPARRTAAIAAYFGVGYIVSTPLPAISGKLADVIGWRACFFVVPIIAVVGLVITWRYVPATVRAHRRLDLVGLCLFAVTLLGLIYGFSRLEMGIDRIGVVSIAVGLLAGGGFVIHERRTPEPALDMRVFGSGRFNAAATAGLVFNFVTAGSLVVLSFYLVTIRQDSPQLLGLLLIPATALSAAAATLAGPAMNRAGARTVLVGGLLVALSGLILMRFFDLNTSTLAVFVAVALIMVGGALVGTPQATIMMSSAPDELGGSIAGVKSAINEGGFSLGPTIFALVGVNYFFNSIVGELHGSGITHEDVRDAMRTAHGGGHDAHVLDPELARLVVEHGPHNMVEAIQTLSLVMAVAPVIAIVLALWLIKPERKDAASR
ncbi:MFS transporter [Mycobacterium sp. CVI_P3]|uniref:MFS transporter n=1 Tax=Mycobacterium pinniadriaticum TaxID=2994102 RepID=A0ABT3S9N3_9MYCO|nr:MFS transporter [Mycobacterium pinniadriaticum]MCX2929776.1 MFS transporter [Mycobacterium pinniadriaticum]MCX2936200.1 MFS transporter [Mycobacterium pinniadriaticum]